MKEITILVTGSRNYPNYDRFKERMEAMYRYMYSKNMIVTKVIHGNCQGADQMTDQWVYDFKERLIDIIRYPITQVDWQEHGKRAGYLRNSKMIEQKPDFVMAFGMGRGTTMTIRLARDKGIRVFHIDNPLRGIEEPPNPSVNIELYGDMIDEL